MNHPHRYRVDVEWTGNRGTGTDGYRNYSRNHVIRVPGKPDLAGSSDPTFRGDATRHNPEDMLVAALSTCHMLSFLHVAREAGFVVTRYRDQAEGLLAKTAEGRLAVTHVTLRPSIDYLGREPTPQEADHLHHLAHETCFIANSVRTEVTVEAPSR